jgi:hypothetical protein
MTRLALAAALAALAVGCVPPKTGDVSRFVAAQPRSILIVPVVNRSVDVNASDYFLSTVPVPVAERGYYVFPTNLVKRTLEDDGLADSVLVHGADPTRLAALFGADAILYVVIERWDAKYVVLSTQVTVDIVYTIKDGKTGATLWTDREIAVYTSDGGNNGLLGALVAAAITKASPSYMPLARQANAKALAFPGPGFPAGPYRPEHGRDYDRAALQAPPPPPAPAPTAAR